jgi:pyrroline-5-carboxylate reductase
MWGVNEVRDVPFREIEIMNSLSLGFIGGGRVTRILLEGLRHGGAHFSQVVVADPAPEVLELVKQSLPGLPIHKGGMAEVSRVSILFIAVHPPAYETVLASLSPHVEQASVVVSLAPKITIAAMTKALGGFDRLVRMIPNAPSIINRGYNPVCYSPGLRGPERESVRELFGLLGSAPEVPESHLEAYAIIAAMGPTYLWFQLEELKRLGMQFGLPEPDATHAVSAMAEGALRTLFESGLTADKVMDLIPVRPLASCEEAIREMYRKALEPLYAKLK